MNKYKQIKNILIRKNAISKINIIKNIILMPSAGKKNLIS